MNGMAWSVFAAALLSSAPVVARGDLGLEVPDDVERALVERRFTVEEDVLRVLAGALEDSHPPAFWSARLARLGVEAAPAVIELLVDVDIRARALADVDAVRAEQNPLATRDSDQQTGADALDRERRVVRGALEHMGREAVIPAVEHRIRSGVAVPEVRLTLLDIVAAVGGARDLDLAIGLVWPPSGGVKDVTPLLPGLNQAISALVRREPDTLAAVEKRILDARHDVAVGLIGATGATDCRIGLQALSDLLGRNADLDPILLAHIGKVGSSVRVRPEAALCDQVRAYLLTNDEQVLRAAVETLGNLRDEDSVEPLIELLDSENDALVRAAIQSLRKTTGMGYPADRLRWTTWYLSERRWYQTRGLELTEQLDDVSEDVVAGALEELSASRIHRAHIAARIVELVDHENAAVRRLACQAVGRLGSSRVLPQLVASLTDPEPEVTAAALGALHRLTQLELGLDAEAWQTALATAE